jgi:hypothetical protein
MGFTVVHPMHSQTLWANVEVSNTIHVGSILSMDTSDPKEGMEILDVAAGAANLTNLDIPWGVVVGNNNSAPNKVYDTSGEYITAGAEAAWHDNTTQYEGVEGPMGYGVSGEMVEYIPITAETVLRGPIRNAAIGTAITEVAVTTASGADGIDFTSAAIDFTPVADYATIYCRTGANMGVYRHLETVSTTVHTMTPAYPADVAVGDTFVAAPLRCWGTTRAYIDSLAVYIDASAALTTNYLLIDVLRLDLSVAGDEYVEFRFNPINFNMIVRADTDTT